MRGLPKKLARVTKKNRGLPRLHGGVAKQKRRGLPKIDARVSHNIVTLTMGDKRQYLVPQTIKMTYNNQPGTDKLTTETFSADKCIYDAFIETR